MSGVLIANPFASRVNDQSLDAVTAALPRDTEVILTRGRGDGASIARELEPSVAVVYAFGGDGTFNEVLNGIALRVPLGFLPGGGTSVLPRALGLPRDPARAAARMTSGATRRISLGRANGRRFSFSAGIGFDAELVRRVDALGRNDEGRRPGDLAFVHALVSLLAEKRGRFDPRLEIEGVGRAAFALVANCSPYSYAGPLGLRPAPHATFDAGLDFVAPVRVRARSLLPLLVGAARGWRAGRDVLAGHDLDRVLVRCDDRLPVQLDGEDIGDLDEIVLESEPDAVTVLV